MSLFVVVVTAVQIGAEMTKVVLEKFIFTCIYFWFHL